MNPSNCFYEYERIPNQNILNAVKENRQLQDYFTPIFDGLKAKQYCGILNIEGDDFYFMDYEDLDFVSEYKIVPLLEEYFFTDPHSLNEAKKIIEEGKQ